MKNMSEFRILFLLVLGAFFLLITSCKKDEPEPLTATDIDGNIYHVVTIGTQDWLVENLKVTHYRNGEPVLNITDNAEWESAIVGAYCDYNNLPATSSTYGKLYNWYAVNDPRNIAPEGWHIASIEEWNILTNFLGGEAVAGGKLKEAGTAHWNSPNEGATNESGFKALPAGYRDFSGSYDYLGKGAEFWTVSEASEVDAWCQWMDFGAADVYSTINLKNFGYSVRCVKN